MAAKKPTSKGSAKAPGMTPQAALAEPSPPPKADGMSAVFLADRFEWRGVAFLPGPMKVSPELLAAMRAAGVLALDRKTDGAAAG